MILFIYNNMSTNFIQVGNDVNGPGNNTKISQDGITWTTIDSNPFLSEGTNVAYGANRWIMVGLSSDNKTIKYSDDNGASWSNSTNAFTGNYGSGSGIGYGLDNNGTPLWVAVGGDGSAPSTITNTIKYSTDGASWSNSTNGFEGVSSGGSYDPGSGNSVACGKNNNGNSLWVAVGRDYTNNTIKYSIDGITWSNANNGFTGNGFGTGVVYGGYNNGTGLWVAVGRPDSNDPNNITIKYSTDGINWSNGTNGFSSYGSGIGYGLDNNGNGLWVAVGGSNNPDYTTIRYSSDGINWSVANNNTGFIGGSQSVGNSVTWGKDSNGNNLWIATGRGGNNGSITIKYSSDGINWSSDLVSNAIVGTGSGVASTTSSPLPPPPPPPPPPPTPSGCDWNPDLSGQTTIWTRYNGDCTYLSGATLNGSPMTREDLSEKRKAVIFQYKNNSAGFSKKQQFSRLARGLGKPRGKTYATQGYNVTNPNVQNLPLVGKNVPTVVDDGTGNFVTQDVFMGTTLVCAGANKISGLTTQNDTPGPTRTITNYPTVPLTNYIVRRTYKGGSEKWPQYGPNTGQPRLPKYARNTGTKPGMNFWRPGSS